MSTPQNNGLDGELRVRALLEANKHKVSLKHKGPFDLLIDGVIRAEVKTCGGAIRSGRDYPHWFFNLHRHGVLNEEEIDIYILRLENIPDFSYAIHALIKAPIKKLTLNVTLRSLINGDWYNYIKEFQNFLKTPPEHIEIWAK